MYNSKNLCIPRSWGPVLAMNESEDIEIHGLILLCEPDRPNVIINNPKGNNAC